MIINHNISSLNAQRMANSSSQLANKTMQKLSSGLRINSAADDAAGLAISEKMSGQIRGLDQSSRNIQDGISLVQTAEGGLNEIHSLLQRGREISVQAANGTLTDDDKKAIQSEIEQIVHEVDRIAGTTDFNGINLLKLDSTSDEKAKIIEYMKKSWLEQSEKIISDHYGLLGDGADLQIKVVDGAAGGVMAYVSGTPDGSGEWTGLSLTVEKADLSPVSWPNGGTAPQYADRVIAHEMTHAVMSRNMDFTALPTWFQEGTAEFTTGADERLTADIAYAGANGTISASDIYTALKTTDPSSWDVPTMSSIDNGIVALSNAVGGMWGADSAAYSGGYLAVRYLDQHIRDAGGAGIKDVMTYLSSNPMSTLDDALKNISNGSYAGGESVFLADFKANAVFYVHNTSKINLIDNDTGSVVHMDTGLPYTAEDVVQDISNPTDNPLTGFNEIWQNFPSNSTALTLQVGANENQNLKINIINVGSENLGLFLANVVTNANNAITTFDNAIKNVSSQRATFGALQNRLEHAQAVIDTSSENLTNAESRIRDVDMAKEMSIFSKKNILSQAAQAMIVQANQQPQGVLQLLR